MIELQPFRPDKAARVQFGELHTDFILPINHGEFHDQVG